MGRPVLPEAHRVVGEHPGDLPLSRPGRVGRTPGGEPLAPLRLRLPATLHGAERLVDAVRDEEPAVRIPADRLLREADLLLAQGLAVGLARSLAVGRRVA